MKTRYSGPSGPDDGGPIIRVIGPKGEELGVMLTDDAVRLADEMGVDLVCISPRAQPAVYKLIDFGRFKFESSKKRRENRRRIHRVAVKEVRIRPVTDEHDFAVKIEMVRRFLADKHMVKVVVAFRGREIAHPDTGTAALGRLLEAVADVAVSNGAPTLEGRKLSVLLRARSMST